MTDKKDPKATSQASTVPAATASTSAAANVSKPGPPPQKTLTNKELKELKKKEKAAKRAAAKAAHGGGSNPDQQHGKSNNNNNKSQKPKTASQLKKQMNSAKIKDTDVKIPAMFSHLETREQRIAASPTIASIVHPSILALTLKISTDI
ncbi:unnamed protein product [Ambrosiozyma monospora]|uniref:Unnamed protein product n=1 Tax=Ambrosiozyma monospora TaxID=43982 RepID=A0ACB5TY89_AMBMO|nr:unnamed protein product [Ambrosiozyma monospora]